METIVVLGIDAADYHLLKRWDCENILLDHHRGIETRSYSIDVPATVEVWTTIASGIPLGDHGMEIESRGWDSRFGTRYLVRIANAASDSVTEFLQSVKDAVFETDQAKPYSTELNHLFKHGEVRNWPGITPARGWVDLNKAFNDLNADEITDQEFRQRCLASSGEYVGWLAAMADMDVPIVGTHIHALDYLGHQYGNRPEQLRSAYETVDQLVGMLAGHVDRLVVVSDHGMQTTVTDDEVPGKHSFRAMASSTFDDDLPAAIDEFRPWLESHVGGRPEPESERTDIDAPKDHLRDLGYL